MWEGLFNAFMIELHNIFESNTANKMRFSYTFNVQFRINMPRALY